MRVAFHRVHVLALTKLPCYDEGIRLRPSVRQSRNLCLAGDWFCNRFGAGTVAAKLPGMLSAHLAAATQGMRPWLVG